MKPLTPLGVIILSALMLLSVSTVALADVVMGTDGNQWASNTHPKHPLPDDCGGSGTLGDLGGTPKSDVIHGHDGCDYIYGKEGNDRIYGGLEMDFIYGGPGNDRVYGEDGHDHLFGGSGPGGPSGNDRLDARDGNNEVGNIEEVHGGSGKDRCYLDSDPDGVKFSGCEFLNGKKNPYPVNQYMNTSDDGPKMQQELRDKVNKYLN